VDFPFPLKEVVEGRARLLVPDVPRRKGPGTKGPYPFYNPTMAVNRDLSAVVLVRWPAKPARILDGLAATGAWGIRMGLEAGIPELGFVDMSPEAAALIGTNLQRNGLKGEVFHGDLRSHLAEGAYDYIDIDPFGPPTPFLGHALHAAKTPSGLGITATDTAPLSGTYPKACQRRYVARPLRCEQGHEIGLRILLGYVERVAQAHGKLTRPLLAFAAEHFFRLHLVVVDGLKESASELAYYLRDREGAFQRVDPREPEAIGPLWTGPLGDPAFVRSLAPTEWTSASGGRLLDTLQHEIDLPPFFVTTDELAKRMRGSPPKLGRFLRTLREVGFSAERTHFHPRGVKTDAPHEEILRAFLAAAPSESTGGSAPSS
jgi:tRNA (guanine26-N2/guanine27-N2)-dimethyltransferase